jgi:hypothetical protein
MPEAESISPVAAPIKAGKMEIFTGGGAALTPEDMPFEGVDESVMAGFAKLMANGAVEGAGETVRCLYRESQGRFSVCYGWFKSGAVLPRHSHNADCVYYVLGGESWARASCARATGFSCPPITVTPTKPVPRASKCWSSATRRTSISVSRAMTTLTGNVWRRPIVNMRRPGQTRPCRRRIVLSP